MDIKFSEKKTGKIYNSSRELAGSCWFDAFCHKTCTSNAAVPAHSNVFVGARLPGEMSLSSLSHMRLPLMFAVRKETGIDKRMIKMIAVMNHQRLSNDCSANQLIGFCYNEVTNS